MSELPRIFHLDFMPEQWSKLRTFAYFMGPPFPESRTVHEALSSCEGHLSKVKVLARIANRLIPDLPKDREELDKYGASRNLSSQEFSALWESMICELYATLDGLREFLYGAYGNVRGIQNQSNEKLFRRAKERAYGPDFPEEVTKLLAEAYDTWFPKLRKLRTELVHGTVGSCTLDDKTKRIRYINSGLGSKRQAFVLEDAIGVLDDFEGKVSALVNAIMERLFKEFDQTPRFVMCGIFLGRIYGRMVKPAVAMDFNHGQCMSWDWFEKLEGHFCPLATKCGAYKNKWPEGTSSHHTP